jgi:hypothetical protein
MLLPSHVISVIDRVKGGDLIFAYYPNQEWLNASQYLGGCSPAS